MVELARRLARIVFAMWRDETRLELIPLGVHGATCRRDEVYNRNSRLILNARPRFRRAGYREARVSRSSLYTTNSSLPGRYSQRNLRLVLTTSVDELYWMRALANSRGVTV